MRIGMDVSSALLPERTGVEEYTYQLARHMLTLPEAREHELVFYAPQNRAFLWHERVLPRLLRASSPDVFFSPSNPLPLRMPQHIRAVATIHGLEWKRTPASYGPLFRAYHSLRTWQTVGRADALITVSERTREGVYQFFGKRVPTIPIEVVYHGKPEIPSRKKKEPAKIKHLVFVGRKDKRKNIARMIEAFHIVRRAHTNSPLCLTIAGSRGNDAYAHKLRSEQFGDATLRVVSYISPKEKHHIMREADILLLPSLDEGFGMPIVEAHAYGIPVVTSAFLREIGDRGATYCNPHSSKSIAEAIMHLLDHDQSYRIQKRAAWENSKRFSWERCAQETLRFLTGVRPL